MNDTSFFKNLPVYKTLRIDTFDDITKTVKIMVQDYILLEESQGFTYRILLPRAEQKYGHNDLSKKIGLNLQLEFLSQLRKRQIKMQLREIKYIHDSSHFGWILMSLKNYEKFFKS